MEAHASWLLHGIKSTNTTHFYLQQSLLKPPYELLGFEINKISELKNKSLW
jgi:hypothetical protein